MPFPYTQSLGRAYYGPSLSDPAKQETTWTNREPERFYPDQGTTSSLLSTGAVFGAAFGSGFIPTGKGKRLWDIYTPTIRAAEEYSPGTILRTFQISNFLSQFEKRPDIFLDPEFLKRNKTYLEYLTKLIGEDTGKQSTLLRLTSEGVSLRGGTLYFGQTKDIALKYASILTAPEGSSARIQSALARNLGMFSAKGMEMHQFFSAAAPFGEDSPLRNPTVSGRVGTIIGGKNIFQYAGRQVGMFGTEYVDRFNRLLKAPLEMEPLQSIFSKAQQGLYRGTKSVFGKGYILDFAVKEGTGLQMLGRLSAKYGLGLGALYMSYSTADYMMRQSEVLDNTAFAEGLTAGIATMGIRANMMLADVAEFTGLQSYRESQEEIAPGSTNLQKLLAFPLIGGFTGAVAGYSNTVYEMFKKQTQEGMTAAEARAAVTKELEEFGTGTPLARFARNLSQRSGFYSRQDWIGSTIKKIATPDKTGDLFYKGVGKLGPVKLTGILGAAIGTALVAPFIPGALIPEKTSEELEKIYSGEEEIPIRKGRWWEFGRSPYEGGRIMYYRPHWYPRMLMRARDKSIYKESEHGELSPLDKFIKREFTYDLERENYYDRPYPITGTAFEDVPLIGPLLAGTIGKIIKPPRLMHTEEWVEGESIKTMPPRFGGRIAKEIGELPPSKPISPYETKGIIGEQAYRFTEMIGLPGFTMTSIKEALTDTPELFDQFAQLESARRMYGAERAYWDLELGGGIGATEAFRRLYPHRRRQIPLYNPIRNTMPDWLPGPGEKGPDLLHGDPYSRVQEGELRLPGEGYAARFPELEGIAPEDYPLIHQYKILADVGPYTNQFKEAQIAIRTARKYDSWTEYEENIYKTTEEQIKKRKTGKEFQEYEYLSPMGDIFDKPNYYDESSGMMAALNEMKAEQEGGKGDGPVSKIFGGYWELLSHNAETSLDMLTPLAPGAKLVHERTAIEAYEREQIFGRQSAFWSHPIRDFIKPFISSSAKSFGYDDIPATVQRKRELEEYFDVLTYVKNARLSNIARASKDYEAVKEFERKKDETLFGLNPFTRNYSSIYRALPRRDRDYFKSFAAADTTEERAKILSLIPENERGLYIAKWKQDFQQDVKRAKKLELLTQEQIDEADQMIEEIYDEARSEGFSTSKELYTEYLATKFDGESYADWYRRTKLLIKYPLPGPDWVGWHPSVDLEDIKLKVVKNTGEDMHDYNLWGDRARSLVQKPYINEEAIEPILNPNEDNSMGEQRALIDKVIGASNVRADTYMRKTFGYDRSDVTIDFEQNVNMGPLLDEVY